AAQSVSVAHYENFPVASRLIPASLRPAVVAIYAFARAADDIADEGDATPAARLTQLDLYSAKLDCIERGEAPADAPFAALAAAHGIRGDAHACAARSGTTPRTSAAAAPFAGAQVRDRRRLENPCRNRRRAGRYLSPATATLRTRLGGDDGSGAGAMTPDAYCEEKAARSGS